MLLKNLFRYWTYQIFSPGTVLREKYEAFKSLLTHDKDAHEIMAELEEIYYNQERVDFQLITDKYNRLSESVVGIILTSASYWRRRIMIPRLLIPLC